MLMSTSKVPFNFSIRPLTAEESDLAQELAMVMALAFEAETPPSARRPYLEQLLASSQFVALAAFHEGRVIGGITAHVLPSFTAEKTELFIYDLAVHPDFQRSGLGKGLLLALKSYGQQHGVEGIFVDAVAEEEHAVNFYRTTGGAGEMVWQFTYLLEK